MQIIVSRRFLVAAPLFAVLKGAVLKRSEAHEIAAARKRDRAAFDALVARHRPALYRFVTRRVRESDRDDILQDTWISVWESLERFDGTCSFRTWVCAICYHKIQDHWRREQCRPPSESIADLEGAGAYIPPEYAGIELTQAMSALWRSYTPAQRELLRMYYVDELTLAEISRVLGRNLSTVKYQFYRAHELAAVRLPEENVGAVRSREVRA